MPVVLGAIVPHHPHSLMTNQHGRMPETIKGINAINNALLEVKPDVIMLVNSHPPIEEDVFLMNVHPEMTFDFSDYGYKAPFPTWKGNMNMSSHLRMQAQDAGFPLQMTTETIGIATSVPLAQFSELAPSATALPVHISAKSPSEHKEFGRFLSNEALSSDAKIALLCSAEFATTGDKANPEIYKPEGETFNDMARTAIDSVDPKPLLTLEERIVGLSGACAYEPLITFLAAVSGKASAPEFVNQEQYQGTTLITALYQF